MDLDVLRLGIHSHGHRRPRVIAVPFGGSLGRPLPGTPAFSPDVQAFCPGLLLFLGRLTRLVHFPDCCSKNCSPQKEESAQSIARAPLRDGLDGRQEQVRSLEKGNQFSLTRPYLRASLWEKSYPRRKSK